MSNEDTKALTKAENERAVNKAVAADIQGSETGVWSGAYVNLIKDRYPDLDLADIRTFGRVCLARGIDPLVGDMYPIVYGKGKARGGKGGRTLVLIESIDSMRKRAYATGMVAETKGPEWWGPDGEWHDVWLEDELPLAARFGVRRRDQDELTWHVRLMKEVRKTGDGDQFWRDSGESAQPVNMIGIAAERHGWRKSVPNLFADLYMTKQFANEIDTMVDALPEGSDPALLGEIVADKDGVIQPEPSPEPESSPEASAPAFDAAKVFSTLDTVMKASKPPFTPSDLERLAGWPPGSSPEQGVAALLAGSEGSESKLAADILVLLVASRASDATAPDSAARMLE